MSSTDESARGNQLLAELRQFTGDLERWRHPLLRKLLYTPGVRHLAENAGAYWLLDAIAGWIPSREFAAAKSDDARIGDIHFWTLNVAQDRSAMLIAQADDSEQPFIEQQIEFSDFPLPSIDLWCAFDGEHWTLMLPSEY